MRPRGLKRRRLQIWCWGLGFALICTYIAFDVLDIDGSNLQTRSALQTVAATAQGEEERFFRLDQSPSEPWARPLPGAGHCVIADTPGLKPEGLRGFAIVRHGPLMPRRLLSLVSSAHHFSSADPDPA
jgi:hypothetical protein